MTHPDRNAEDEGAMRTCRKCREQYEWVANGMCEDCQADFDDSDLEDKLVQAWSMK